MSVQNSVRLIGNIGQDPITKKTDTGVVILSVSLATNESYKNDKGEKITKTEWHNLVMFNKKALNIEKYCKKGSRVAVDGKLQTRVYQNKEGVDVYRTEIVVEDIYFLS